MKLKLTDILKGVINEDTWGNNPAAAGAMSPGKTPNAVSPAPTTNTKFYDVGSAFKSFETNIEREEETASRALETTLKQNLANKKVISRASKGSVGQTEQDYTVDVADVKVTYMSDKYYVILTGNDKKDYYINTAFKIKVVGEVEKNGASKPETAQPPQSGMNRPMGISYPQNMGIGSNKSPGK